MRYKEDLIKRVLDKTDIVELIGRYTKLKNVGSVYVGTCPIDKKGMETLVVYPDKQAFHCLNCGKGGNAIAFLMEAKGFQMFEAVNLLAKAAGITIQQTDIEKENRALKDDLYAIYHDATLFYEGHLQTDEGKVARDYLTEREVSDNTTKTFHLGYSPTKGNSLYKYLKKKGYSDDLLLQSQLIKLSESKQPYDFFRGRVMFPILDEQGKTVAFGGRVMSDEQKPKYLNSPETPIFNKSATFYGLHDVKGVKSNFFLLCEGYMDVISLHQAGFRNSVATLGTAFTATHIPQIKKHTNNLILTFDGDDAGQKAVMRTLSTLENAQMGVKILSMHPHKDPDAFIKSLGKQEYVERIRTSIPPIDFQLKYLAKSYDISDQEQRQQYLTEAVNAIMRQTGRRPTQTQSQERG